MHVVTHHGRCGQEKQGLLKGSTHKQMRRGGVTYLSHTVYTLCPASVWHMLHVCVCVCVCISVCLCRCVREVEDVVGEGRGSKRQGVRNLSPVSLTCNISCPVLKKKNVCYPSQLLSDFVFLIYFYKEDL